MNFFDGLYHNKVFMISFISWFSAQLLKVVLTLFTQKKLDFSRFVGSGGMPSSHSSFVTGLASSMGILQGFDSPEFALALVFALIVMYDAAGVRMAVGKQARILNAIVDDFQKHRKHAFNEKRLKELVGHTPVEVFAGAILGIVIANILLK